MKKQFFERNEKQTNSGITLIALVVTIVVVLIIAGISINTIFGDNGVISNSKKIKELNERASIKEQLSTEVIASVDDFQEIDFETLNKNLRNINATVYYNQEELSDENKIQVLPAEVVINGKYYSIKGNWDVVSEVVGDASYINHHVMDYYGCEVTNYDVDIDDDNTNNDWKVFYSDDENIYLIATDYIKFDKAPVKKVDENDTGVTVNNNYDENDENSGYKLWFIDIFKTKNLDDTYKYYANGADDIDVELQKLNKKFFDYLETNIGVSKTNDNIREVAYMLDTTIWNEIFLDTKGIGKYAIGGPSVEMLFDSYNKTHVNAMLRYYSIR